MHPADPLGSLTPAEAPLIKAEKLSEQAGPALIHSAEEISIVLKAFDGKPNVGVVASYLCT